MMFLLNVGMQWSENIVYSNSEAGKWVTIPANIGFPPVLYLESSNAGQSIQDYINSQQYNDGYVWDYSDSDAPRDDNDDDTPVYMIVVFSLMGVALLVSLLVVTYRFIDNNQKGNEMIDQHAKPLLGDDPK